MNILLCTKDEEYKGGAETYFSNITATLRQLNVTLETFNFEGIGRNTHAKLRLSPPLLWVDDLEFASFIHKLCYFNPNIIHFNRNFFFTQQQIATLKRFRIPILLTVHDYFSVPFPINLKNIIKRKIYNYHWFADAYIIPSISYYHKLISHNIRNVHYVPHFVDLHDWNYTRQRKDSPKRILYVGRLEHEKGIFFLLEVIKELLLEDEDIILTIIGKGSCQQQFLGKAQQLNIRHKIEMEGYKNKQELATYYAEATLLIVPTLCAELFGLVGLEAQASGLPVIATDLEGITEWCINGYTGITFAPNNSSEVQQKIKLLFSDKQLYHQISCNAYTFVAKNFSKEVAMQKLLTLYQHFAYEI